MARFFRVSMMMLFLLSGFSFHAVALGTDSLAVYGMVMDNFTREALPKVRIQMLDAAGETLGSCHTIDRAGKVAGKPCNFFGITLPRGQRSAIFLLSKEGYEDLFVTVSLKAGKREDYVWAGDFLMKKIHRLNEAVVMASKVMMVVKGDTVVYNADAFQLSEGSMLDALVRQLPGVELEDGRISVNGKFVSRLLVNGEDFFRGDPKVALDNLPAYMVDKVKVYEKEAPDAYIKGKGLNGEDPLVMDVNLKKQYSVGWIANAEGGYGTRDRFRAKVFGLRFTDHSRLALFGNANNVGDVREPGSTGNWNAAGAALSGTGVLKSGGLDLLINDKYKKWKLQSNLKAQHKDIHTLKETSAVRFLEGGDVWKRARDYGQNCHTTLSTEHKLEFPLPQVYLSFQPSGSYRHYDYRSGMQSADFGSELSESYRGAALDSIFLHPGSSRLEESLINRLETSTRGNGFYWNTGIFADASMNVPHTPDFLSISVKGNVSRAEDKAFDLYDLRGKSAAGDYRNTYDFQPEKHRDFEASALYLMRLPKSITMIYEYKFSSGYSSGGRSLYRLDRFEKWSDSDNPLMGALPSTTDSMQLALDARNSFHSALTTNENFFKVSFSKYVGYGQNNMYVDMKLRYRMDHLDYRRDILVADDTRRKLLPELDVFLPFLGHYSVKYSFRQELPVMTDLVELTDDANPLYIRHGNPDLKNSHRHNASFEAGWKNDKKNSTTDVGLSYELIRRAIGNATTYDRRTGVVSSTLRNIDGNWHITANVNHNTPFGKKRRLHFSTATRFVFHNSVDFTSATSDALRPERSSVRNFNLAQTLQAKYRTGKHFFSAKVNAEWRYANSPRPDFSIISCLDLYYGLTGQLKLPGGVDLSTDLTLYTRRGYEGAGMNTNDWVWNARVSKGFLHGNLVFAVDGFDILRQLSNVRSYIDAQGRTETRYNVVPNYFLASVIYRLNVKPKKDRK